MCISEIRNKMVRLDVSQHIPTALELTRKNYRILKFPSALYMAKPRVRLQMSVVWLFLATGPLQ